MDINVIINTGVENEIGFAYSTEDGGESVVTTMYENRVNPLKSDVDIIEELAEGKAYGGDNRTQLEAVNEMLGFWLDVHLEDLKGRIYTFESISAAYKAMKEENLEFILYVEPGDSHLLESDII